MLAAGFAEHAECVLAELIEDGSLNWKLLAAGVVEYAECVFPELIEDGSLN